MAQKKKPAGNAFDAFATSATPGKKSSSKKIAVTNMTEELKIQVDLIIKNKAQIKALKAEQDAAELALIEHVFPIQEEEARSGNFCKSFTVQGTDPEASPLTITWADKWSVPKEEDVHEEIKKLLAKQFDDYMKKTRMVTFTEDAMQDAELINDMVAVAKEHGYSVTEVFIIIDSLTCVKAMDEKQFNLPKTKLAALRTLIKQYKATIK